jgi:serine/threonine protein kinase
MSQTQTQTESCESCGSLLDITGAPIFAERTCPVCSEQIHVNRQFDHFELLKIMGQGGQGTVFRAKDTTLDRLVALKILRSEHASDPVFVRQFEHEARLTASIAHPNVVRVYSFGARDGHVFLAMELVDGGTLDGLMERTGRIPEAQALQVGIEIAQGLRAGFEKGLIHRDVKPGNMLFGADGTAKIVDFGLAVVMEHEAQAAGEIWGTPYYIPPERLQRLQEDFRADLYSLGGSLFHAIAGRPPFEAKDASHVALKHLSSHAASIQAFAPDVSNATAYVINRSLLKNRDERQASYDEFIKQLQFARDEVLARDRAGGRTPKKARVVMEDPSANQTMGRVMLVTFGVILIGLVVGGIMIFNALKKDDGAVEAVLSGPATLEAFGPGWGEAKEALLGNDWTKASVAFSALAAKHPVKSQQHDWAVVHQALSEQFRLGGDAAGKVLGRLPDSSTQLKKFFREQIRPHLTDSMRIRAADKTAFNKSNHEALGALFLALRNYELGHVEDARAFFRQFTALTPDSNVAWLADYRKLAKPYEDELVALDLAAGAWKSAQNDRERTTALAALRALPAKLRKESKLLANARQLIAEAEKRVAEDDKRIAEAAKRAAAELAEKNKGNFAFKATATASASNKNETPDKAVDGNPATFWSAGGSGEKWLAVALGGPKPISRWVVHTASSAGGKPEQDLSDFKLQRSDDGKTWADVDAVVENRCGVVDRVVPPFTAAHARILILKETRKPQDKVAQIRGFALGAAADQARATYEPSQTVALRFSTATPFVGGTIGDVGAVGTMQFDEKAGKFTVKGSGQDIFGNADAFQFVWQPVTGDCEIVARVASFQGQNPGAKAGLMIRSDPAREATHASALLVPGGKLEFISRPEPNKPSKSEAKQGLPVPRWLKLVRQGAVVIGFESADGKDWKEIGRATPAGLGPSAFVGLAVCARDKGKLAAAEFTDVRIQQTKP